MHDGNVCKSRSNLSKGSSYEVFVPCSCCAVPGDRCSRRNGGRSHDGRLPVRIFVSTKKNRHHHGVIPSKQSFHMRIDGSLIQAKKKELEPGQTPSEWGIKRPQVLYQLDLHLCQTRTIENLQLCAFIPHCVSLNLSVNYLSRIEGLSPLLALRHLDLSVNGIEKIEGLELLQNLRVLNLSKNRITRIQGLSKQAELRTLVLRCFFRFEFSPLSAILLPLCQLNNLLRIPSLVRARRPLAQKRDV